MVARKLLRLIPRGFRTYCLWTVCVIFVSLLAYYIHFRSTFGFEKSLQWASSRIILERKDVTDFKEKQSVPQQQESVTNQQEDGRKVTKQEYSCQVPQIDPFHPSILPYLEKPRDIKCNRVQVDLVYLDGKGRLRVNETAIKGAKNGKISCWYQYFDRGNTDADIVFGKKYQLEKPVKMIQPFVKAACDQGPNATRVFVNFFANPSVPLESSKSTPQSMNGTDVSVYILCLESTSSSMVYRHLPRTLGHLYRTGAITVRNFQKAGENTIPNLAAILTGKRAWEEQDMPAELPEPSHGFYDEWPMLWKKYRQKGYETMFMEDTPRISTFHYRGKGFKEKPVDRWYYPFWNALRQRKDVDSASSEFCFGNVPILKIFTDIVGGELSRASTQNRRQFMLTLMNHLSHDYTSDLERADDTLFQLLHRLDSKGAMNRTILIIMGDHGPRISTYRPTAIGFAEERLPFLSIRIPPFLYSKYPRLREILELNAASRLVSMFDLHETLLDIVDDVFDGTASDDQSIRGRSLFRPIPSDRTCFQAGVPDRYCLCDGFQEIPHDHVAAKPAVKAVLKEVNKMVSKHKDKCATWKFDKILYLLKVPWRGEVVGKTKTYFVAFKTKPDGILEGVVVRNMTDDSVRLKEGNGTLERINPVGDSGDCVPDMWKFCECKKL